MTLELKGAGIKIDERWPVRGATLSLRPGRLTALVGPNGSGKTTLLRLLGGLWRPTEGGVLLGGRDLHTIPRREVARRVAFTPQDTHLSFAFTVRDVVAMGRHPHLGRFEREGERDQRAVEEAIGRADVTHLTGRLITELSGGERQRVLIARSLATEADTILLDEPTANLDIAHALDVLDLCRNLVEEGKSVALAIHDLNLAARYAAEIVLVNEGRVVTTGAPGGVLSDSAIREVFGVRTERAVGPDGGTAFLFHRPRDEGSSGASAVGGRRP